MNTIIFQLLIVVDQFTAYYDLKSAVNGSVLNMKDGYLLMCAFEISYSVTMIFVNQFIIYHAPFKDELTEFVEGCLKPCCSYELIQFNNNILL